MNRDSMLELRVLTGTHAGARALLADVPHLIGSDDDCALILSDAGILRRHASLEYQPDGSILLRLLDGDSPPLVIRPGQGTWLGPVQLAVERVDTPWQDKVPLLEPSEPDPAQKDTTDSCGPPPRRFEPVARWTRAMPGVAVAVGLLGAVLWPVVHALQGTDAAAATAHTPAPSSAPVSTPIDAIQRVVSGLGLTAQVTLDQTDPQSPVVHAEFISEDEVLALAQALARLSPRPRLVTADDTQLAGTALLRDLQRQGLGHITGQWIDGTLVVDAVLSPGMQPRWEQALVAAAARHALPFRAQVSTAHMTPLASTGPLPFAVRSVVTNPLPHVTLTDGRKLFVGGRLDGWQLTGISPRALTFEDRQGHRITQEP
ncbi:MAG: hypothetical protein RL522_703 [Pseudomonadota bacterium]|jgi:hypothetical protein